MATWIYLHEPGMYTQQQVKWNGTLSGMFMYMNLEHHDSEHI